MTSNRKKIKDLEEIIALADMLKVKAIGLRRELVGVHPSASPKRGKGVSDEIINSILIKRRIKRIA